MAEKKHLFAGKHTLDAARDFPDLRDRLYQPALIPLESEIAPPDGLHVLDQGNEGACTGFGLAAVINRLHQQRGDEIHASARMLYEMARRFDEWRGEDYSGSSCRGAIRGWYHMGVCREEVWPYADTDRHMNLQRARDARAQTLGAYYRLRPHLSDYHAALNETGVLFVSADIHKGWTEAGTRRDGLINFNPRNRPEGGHAFALVGYNQQGFWVQNSWGTGWGKGGLALWTYEDWLKNIKDGWVVRLAVSTPQLWDMEAGGEFTSTGEEDRSGFFWKRKPKRSEIAGHFVHIDDGRFHPKGKYWSSLEDVQETVTYLASAEGREKYPHLLWYAHGGLNSVTDSARRVRAMVEVFKENGIYPFHFMYDTGLMEEIKDVVLGQKERSVERVGGFTDYTDQAVEAATRVSGRALWREMKAGARSPFAGQAAGLEILHAFAEGGAFTGRSLHAVGHSTGGILLAHLLQALATISPKQRVKSLSLLAPAATTALFESHIRPLLKTPARQAGIDETTIYNLNDRLEKDDNVAFLYRKSLLYLVSNAFEEAPRQPLLGMKIFAEKLDLPNNPGQKLGLSFVYSSGGSSGRSRSESHGGFDNDPSTMNDVLKRVLGRRPKARFDKKTLKY